MLKSDSSALATIRKEQGQEATEEVLYLLLTGLVNFFNVGKTMSAVQIRETARLILSDYYFLKIADLQLFVDKFKKGEFGALFDRLDGGVILSAIKTYCEERIAVCEQINANKHKELKADSKAVYRVSVGKQFIREVEPGVLENVNEREIATLFDYKTAYQIMKWLLQNDETDVKISDSTKGGETLFNYLEKNNPELLKEINKAAEDKQAEKYRRTEYFALRRSILANESLSPYEKENAIRELSGLEPLSQSEYEKQQQVYSQTK